MDIENIRLSSKDIALFLQKIGVEYHANQLLLLNNIIKGMLTHIPFHNLYLLGAAGTPMTIEKTIINMLAGHGGLCDSQNPFLFILLKSLGFDVDFLCASMMQENCHILLRVTIADEAYCVDVGNGYPYFAAMSLEKTTLFNHPFISHKIMRDGKKYSMYHKNKGQKWVADYHFYNAPVPYDFFNSMLENHYNNNGWGPFLNGLRIMKWTDTGAVMIKDHLLWLPEQRLKMKINNAAELKIYLSKYFLLEALMREIDIDIIWNIWRQNNAKNT